MNFKSRFDQVVAGSVAVLALFLVGMIAGGDFTQPQIQYFNADHTEISPQQSQLLFRFNRLMNEKSVENNFHISPAVPGRFSWSGRTMAFTSIEPLHYGEHYTVTFRGALDRSGKSMPPTVLTATTRQATALFLNAEGQIMALTLLDHKTKLLSPESLFVQQFAVAPTGDFIAFLAAPKKSTLTDKSVFHLYVQNLASAEFDELPTASTIIMDDVTWVPDGSAVAFSFVDMHTNKEGIDMYDLTSKKITAIAPEKARAYEFSFTPDSEQVAYIDTNGALILGAMPTGNGSLVSTAFIDLNGFSSQGDQLSYTLPASVNAFDLANIPVLVNSAGDEKRIPVPKDSTSFDVRFVPTKKSLVFVLEESLGTERKDSIASFDYEKNQLQVLVDKPNCTSIQPRVSPDATSLVWQCAQNEHKGYVLTGWNDYRGEIVTADIWIKDLLTGEEKSLGVKGADVEFLP